MAMPHRHDAPAAPPPPPPPLPPQRYGHRAANAIARLAHPFFFGSRPSSAHGDGDTRQARKPKPNAPRTSSPLPSRTAIHKTGIPIVAVDISPDRTHAVLAGRDILKTIRIHSNACTEDFNLRAHVIAYASTQKAPSDAASAVHKDQLVATDVSWSSGRYDTVVATAAANGRIVLYDINRTGVVLARLHEHTRQVHRVAFNPFQGALLISGSQDATVRMWDLRTLSGERSVLTCRTTHRFAGNNEGIRDVRWSPTDGAQFASGTDNGVVHKWDFTNPKVPLLKINAHDKTCHALDWHASGRYLASGGADQLVKVWDFHSTHRRQKPLMVLRAPQPVKTLRWRPGTGLAGEPAVDSGLCTQLATSYDQHDPRIHIWDVQRPHVPCQEIDRHEQPPSALLWRSRDLLWSVGESGMFTQTDMQLVPLLAAKRSANFIAAAPNGLICVFAEGRRRRKRFHAPLNDPVHRPGGKSSGSSGDKLGSSRSATEGSQEDPGILSATLRRHGPRWSASTVTAQVPLVLDTSRLETSLERALQHHDDGSYRTRQRGATGHIPGAFDHQAFADLAASYVPPAWNDHWSSSPAIHDTLRAVFYRNASCAATAGHYRLAQSWKVLGEAIYMELLARAETALKRRLAAQHPVRGVRKKHEPLVLTGSTNMPSQRSPRVVDPARDAPSNMPTPLVRPLQPRATMTSDARNLPGEHLPGEHAPTSMLPPPAQEGDERAATVEGRVTDGHSAGGPAISLASVARDDQAPSTTATRVTSPVLNSFADIDQHMHERRAALKDYQARPRAPLTLDDPYRRAQASPTPLALERFDSIDSFQLFASSSDSITVPPPMGSLGSSQQSKLSDVLDDEWDPIHQHDLPPGVLSAALDPSPPNKLQPVMAPFHAQVNLWAKKWTERQREASAKASHDATSEALTEGISEVSEGTTHGRDSQIPFDHVRFRPGPFALQRPSRVSQPIVRHAVKKKKPARKTAAASKSSSPYQAADFAATTAPSSHPVPWRVSAVVPATMDFHLRVLGDLQLPSYLLLYLMPLFPSLVPRSLVSKVLTCYHEQLTSCGLFIAAAALRNHCYPAFTSISALHAGETVDVVCGTCLKPPQGSINGYCERCGQSWLDCPICNQTECPFLLPARGTTPTAQSRLWMLCPGCGHTAHKNCMTTWLADPRSEGSCAIDGCEHICVPRFAPTLDPAADDATDEETAPPDERKDEGGPAVTSDRWVIEDSEAVESARDMVAGRTAVSTGNSTTTSNPAARPPGRAVRWGAGLAGASPTVGGVGGGGGGGGEGGGEGERGGGRGGGRRLGRS